MTNNNKTRTAEEFEIACARWNALSVAERTKLIKRDPSMRQKCFAGLVARLAASTTDKMSALHLATVTEFVYYA